MTGGMTGVRDSNALEPTICELKHDRRTAQERVERGGRPELDEAKKNRDNCRQGKTDEGLAHLDNLERLRKWKHVVSPHGQ